MRFHRLCLYIPFLQLVLSTPIDPEPATLSLLAKTPTKKPDQSENFEHPVIQNPVEIPSETAPLCAYLYYWVCVH